MMVDIRHTSKGKTIEDTGTATPTDSRLSDGQHTDFYVLSPEERKKGWVRPYRDTYKHVSKCNKETKIAAKAICETFAKEPSYYGRTFCTECCDYFPLIEFNWVEDGTEVGS